MLHQKYETPEVELTVLESGDFITTSDEVGKIENAGANKDNSFGPFVPVG